MRSLYNYIITNLFYRVLIKTYVGYDFYTNSWRVYIKLPFAELDPIVHDIVFIADYKDSYEAYEQAKKLARKAEEDGMRWFRQIVKQYG